MTEWKRDTQKSAEKAHPIEKGDEFISMGKKRFKQISKEIHSITDKTLSKELKHLEANKLIRREVLSTFPPTVEYSLTKHGKSLQRLLDELHCCGLKHRKEVIGK